MMVAMFWVGICWCF